MKREQKNKKIEKLYTCDICRKEFNFKSNYIKCKKKHAEKSEQNEKNVRVNEISREPFEMDDNLKIFSMQELEKEAEAEMSKDNYSGVDAYNSNIIKEEAIESDDIIDNSSDPPENVRVDTSIIKEEAKESDDIIDSSYDPSRFVDVKEEIDDDTEMIYDPLFVSMEVIHHIVFLFWIK